MFVIEEIAEVTIRPDKRIFMLSHAEIKEEMDELGKNVGRTYCMINSFHKESVRGEFAVNLITKEILINFSTSYGIYGLLRRELYNMFWLPHNIGAILTGREGQIRVSLTLEQICKGLFGPEERWREFNKEWRNFDKAESKDRDDQKPNRL